MKAAMVAKVPVGSAYWRYIWGIYSIIYIYIYVIYKIIYIYMFLYMGSEIWDMIGTYRLTWGYSVYGLKKGAPKSRAYHHFPY